MKTNNQTQDVAVATRIREFIYDRSIDYGTVVPISECNSNDLDDIIGSGELEVGCRLDDADSFAGVSDFDRASLVYFPGTITTTQQLTLLKLVQLPLYFTEVKSFTPISAEDLLAREQLARDTGFVLYGPDECLAILYQYDGGYTFCEAFENNDLGVLRHKAGIFATGLEYYATPKHIVDLNETQTNRALADARGEFLWWAPQTAIVSATQIDRMKRTIELLMQHLTHAMPERKESGAIVRRSFISNGSTEDTLHMRPHAEGWRRYPTSQDAWYFGQWVNPQKLQMLSYCEQDVVHVTCETQAQFDAEMKEMSNFYGRTPSPSVIAIGDDGTSAYFEVMSFLTKPTAEVCFQNGMDAKDGNGKWVTPIAGTLKIDHPALASLTEGETVEVGRDCFELNLLDPRSFESAYTAKVKKNGEAFTIDINLIDLGIQLSASVN